MACSILPHGKQSEHKQRRRAEGTSVYAQQVSRWLGGVYKTPVDQLLTCDLSAAAYSVRIVPLAAELAPGQ